MDFAFSEAQKHWHDATKQFALEKLKDAESVEPRPAGRVLAGGLSSVVLVSEFRGCRSLANTAVRVKTCRRPWRPWKDSATAVPTTG